jgi:cellulose synthase/poly-beta-1,6-N-acetylglucosamine synthase-like glycosyltransferase
LTEDTAISFKIMQQNKLIALAQNSEAFQQEPETIQAYFYQRKRWAKGNYEVILDNIHHVFKRKSNWRIKLEVLYYTSTFFWFNFAIIISNFLFIVNLFAMIIRLFNGQFVFRLPLLVLTDKLHYFACQLGFDVLYLFVADQYRLSESIWSSDIKKFAIFNCILLYLFTTFYPCRN